MITQKKPTSALVGILLLLISIILMIITVPLGFIYAMLNQFFEFGFKGIGKYALSVAISIDQLGNVIMQHLLNLLIIKDVRVQDKIILKYKFGNRDETVSSVIGKNKQQGTLSDFGRFIDKILDIIQKDHSLNSIDYYIEP